MLGGGIVGVSLAYHLSRLKVGSVALVDRGPGSIGGSSRCAGMLTHQGWGPWDLGLVRESATEYARISDNTGWGRYTRNGGLRVVRTPEGEQWLTRAADVLRSGGEEARMLEPSEIRTAFPIADLDDARCGLLTPADATFDTVEMMRAYGVMGRRQGVRFSSVSGAPRIDPEGDGWRITDGEAAWKTTRLVVACGAWTKGVLDGVGRRLPLAPFRTQAAVLRPLPLSPSFPTLHDVDLGLYLRPAHHGRVLAGDGTELLESDPETVAYDADRSFLDGISSRLRPLFPEWRSLQAEKAWAGMCVASPDRYPLVGKVPGATGLFVASGFNGFGAMRAPALARRLAEGIADGQWESLMPADPARFPASFEPFPPRPEFPLRDDGGLDDREARVRTPSSLPASSFAGDLDLGYRSLAREEEVRALRLPSLSEWFDPFLPLFMRDALRCGGEVQVAEEEGEVRGVYLYTPAENTGSIFTRLRGVAGRFLTLHPRSEVYAEQAWGPGSQPLHVMMADLADWDARAHPVRVPVRIGEAEDLPRVKALLREVAGPVDEVWFRGLPRPEELCFLCEVEGRLAGVSWLSLAGHHGRGHSLAVHPRYRGLGIGTDLLVARMLWLKDHGFRDVVSEIYGGNQAPQTAAERAGMARVGLMYALHPA